MLAPSAVTHCAHLCMVNGSKTADFMGSRKFGNNAHKSTLNYSPIIVSIGAKKSDASKPKFQKHVYKWMHIMIETGQWQFAWTRDDTKQEHVFQFILHLWRKVETDKWHQTNGFFLPSLFVTQGIKVIHTEGKDISTFFATRTSTRMLAIKAFEVS